jgi:hypothetical protein
MILRRGPVGNGRTFHFEKGYLFGGEDYPFHMERIVFFIEGELSL